MTQERVMAESNRIFECITGSNLYGFATATSDIDRRGCFIPSKDYTFGMKEVEQVEQKSPDRTIYSIYKLFKLLATNNSTIMEMLFVPEKHIILIEDEWDEIRKNAHLFMSKKIKFTFTGYAFAQMKRIAGHKKWNDDPDETPPKKEDFINTMKLKIGEKPQVIQHGWSEITVTDINYETQEITIQYFREAEYKTHLKHHHEYLTWKENRNETRSELEKKYGYDCKHACHLIRLLKMCLETLHDHTIYVDRAEYGDAQLYLDIRSGKYKYEELMDMATEINNQIEDHYEKSTLQYTPNFEKINELLIKVVGKYYGKKQDFDNFRLW